MDTKFYTIPELAKVLDLHPKTVLRFIHEDKIKAAKIGRTWRVSEEELRRFCHGELSGGHAGEIAGHEPPAARNPKAPKTAIPLEGRIRVSAVVEITEQDSEEATRISNSMLAMLAGEREGSSGTRFDFFYYPESAKAKYVFYGEPQVIARILETFGLLCAQQD